MNTQPSSTAARQSVLSQAQALAGRFAAIGGRVEELRQGLAVQVNSSVDSINAYSGEIASINKQIAILQQGSGRLPNDLLDRRDTLVQKLNELVKTDVVIQDDGSYSVFIGQGQALVLGDQAGKMVMERINPDDPDAVSVGIAIPNVSGTIAIDPARMGGGKLEGIMQVLGTDVRRIQTDLGRMAVELSDAFNRQHELGYDLNGQPATGSLFFNDLTAERTAAEAAGVSRTVRLSSCVRRWTSLAWPWPTRPRLPPHPACRPAMWPTRWPANPALPPSGRWLTCISPPRRHWTATRPWARY